MNMHATSFDEYFSKSEEYETDLRAVDALIRTHAPHLAPLIFNGMGGGVVLAYGLIPYKTKSMKNQSEWPLLALARQKNYIALYACAIINEQYVGEYYGDRLGKVSVGKSCIRFKKLSDVDNRALIAMLSDIDKRYKNGENLYGTI